MLNLWSTYELPMRLTVGGGVNYSDGNFFNQTGTFNFVGGGTVRSRSTRPTRRPFRR